MTRYRKRGQGAAATAVAEGKVRATVKGFLAAIAARGDAAVCAMSETFDRWSPAGFRLDEAGIERALEAVFRRTSRTSTRLRAEHIDGC